MGISDLKDSLQEFKIQSFQDLKNSRFGKYSITQIITIIYGLSTHIRETMLKRLLAFNGIDMNVTRNISSHNYDALNYRILYSIIEKLIDDKIFNELSDYLGVDYDATTRR